MTKSSTSKLEPFDHEIEKTFHKMRNLVGEKLSPRNQLVKMEQTPAPVGVGVRVGVGVGVGVGVVRTKNPRRTLM